jgi:hypothetical protein
MKKHLLLALSLAAATLTPSIARADSVHVGYDTTTIGGVSLSGLSASGSLDLTENISLELSTGSVDTTVSGLKVSLSSTAVGVGYNTALSDTVDLKLVVASVSQALTASWGGYTDSADGSSTAYGALLKAEITGGVDGMAGFSKSTEAGSKINTMFGISVGVSDTMDLTLSMSNNSVVKNTSIGVRYNF